MNLDFKEAELGREVGLVRKVSELWVGMAGVEGFGTLRRCRTRALCDR
jgi:hypothetical protein